VTLGRRERRPRTRRSPTPAFDWKTRQAESRSRRLGASASRDLGRRGTVLLASPRAREGPAETVCSPDRDLGASGSLPRPFEFTVRRRRTTRARPVAARRWWVRSSPARADGHHARRRPPSRGAVYDAVRSVAAGTRPARAGSPQDVLDVGEARSDVRLPRRPGLGPRARPDGRFVAGASARGLARTGRSSGEARPTRRGRSRRRCQRARGRPGLPARSESDGAGRRAVAGRLAGVAAGADGLVLRAEPVPRDRRCSSGSCRAGRRCGVRSRCARRRRAASPRREPTSAARASRAAAVGVRVAFAADATKDGRFRVAAREVSSRATRRGDAAVRAGSRVTGVVVDSGGTPPRCGSRAGAAAAGSSRRVRPRRRFRLRIPASPPAVQLTVVAARRRRPAGRRVRRRGRRCGATARVRRAATMRACQGRPPGRASIVEAVDARGRAAAWSARLEGGSPRSAASTRWSDVDLGLAVEDARVAEAFDVVEARSSRSRHRGDVGRHPRRTSSRSGCTSARRRSFLP